MDDNRAVSLKELVNKRLKELYALWDEIGFDETTQRDRSKTVEDHFKVLLERMIKEENELKKRLVESLEYCMNQCVKLSKELCLTYEEPESDQSLIKLENVLRGENKRLESARKERMIEQTNLRRKDKVLCQTLGMDPYCVSTSNLLSSCQLEGLKEHIQSLQTEKVVRMEQFERLKTNILNLYKDLEEEPETDFEREVACEDTDRFVLSTANIIKVEDIVNKLEMKTKENKRLVREAAEKVDGLYEFLQLSLVDKVHLNLTNQGHGSTVVSRMQMEVESLEKMKKANIKKSVCALRIELQELWDKCFFHQLERDKFTPMHGTDFTEELLESHEEHLSKVKKYFNDNKELLNKVSQRQKIWNKFVELEKRAQDPHRLQFGWSSNVVMEDKEKNNAKQALSNLDEELIKHTSEWKEQNQTEFLVNGVSFKDFIGTQQEDHLKDLDIEKQERERKMKGRILPEKKYEMKSCTPSGSRSRPWSSSKESSKAGQRSAPDSVMANLRTIREGRIGKRTNTRLGGDKAIKNKNVLAANVVKMKQGILMDNNLAAKGEDVIINSGMEQSLASTVPDYGRFKEGDIFSSTVAPASSSHSKGTRHLPHKNTSKTPVKLGLRSNERQKGIKSPESSKLSTPSTMWRRNSSKTTPKRQGLTPNSSNSRGNIRGTTGTTPRHKNAVNIKVSAENDSIISKDKDQNMTLSVVDYDSFKQGNMLNSTETNATNLHREVIKPQSSYMTTKTALTTETRSTLRLGGKGASKISTPRSSSKR